MKPMKALLALLALSAAVPAALPFDLDTVTVGNAGNDGEWAGESYGGYGPDRLCGAVDYAYEIGTFEVTAGEYTAFLNAVAVFDPHYLYSGSMHTEHGCGIIREGTWPGPFTYSVPRDKAERPVNYVTWADAARFCNWLHNGQPNGEQDLTTTEDGSYFVNGAMTAPDLQAITRNPNATWVLPTEDEWYKAAYHHNDGATANYFDYPTSSNDIPSNELVDPDPGNNATYFDEGYTVGSPHYRTEAGAHESSESPYGTFDQGGNVWEWTETTMARDFRVLRGGSYVSSADSLAAAYRYGYYPVAGAISDFGFRVARVPEPHTLSMLLAFSLLACRRFRR